MDVIQKVVVYAMQDKNIKTMIKIIPKAEVLQEEHFLKFFEEHVNFLKTIPPNLIITIEELWDISFKYDVSTKIIIEMIQNILKKEFENGNLYGTFRFEKVKPFLDKEIEQKFEKVDSYHLDISNIYEKF